MERKNKKKNQPKKEACILSITEVKIYSFKKFNR